MKFAMLAVLLLTTFSAFAEDKPAKEPTDLVKLRKAYDAKVKAAVDPITAAYLTKLDEMKKAYGAKGDLESAQAVQKEIEAMTSEKAKSQIKRKSAVTIVGKWVWPSGETVEFQKDGTCKNGGGFTGKWNCLDNKARKYQASWTTGSVDSMVMSSDGATIVCTNRGNIFTAKRLPTDEEK